MSCEKTEQFVAGYADGELDLALKVEMEEHLRGCAECARELDQIVGLRALLRRSALAYPAPAVLHTRIEAALPDTPRADSGGLESSAAPERAAFVRWAAAFALVAACALIAWRVTPRPPAAPAGATGGQGLVAEVFADHLRSLEADHLMDVASTDQHTVKPWFDGKLDFSPPVVDLASDGFPLVGGRLDYLGGRKVAALVYQKRMHYINVFVWPTGAVAPAPPQSGVDAFQGYYLKSWAQGGFEFRAVSDVNRDDLDAFAKLLQSKLP